MVIVDLWIFAANEIYIMKKKLDPISVVLDCFRVPCVRQFPSKRGGEPIIATRCWEFTIEEPQRHNYNVQTHQDILLLIDKQFFLGNLEMEPDLTSYPVAPPNPPSESLGVSKLGPNSITCMYTEQEEVRHGTKYKCTNTESTKTF